MIKPFDKQIVNIDESGKKFEIALEGAGEPTVVLINGGGGPIEGWMKVWPLMEKTTTLFAYNRLGVGESSEPTEPQTATVMAEDLRKLLKAVELKPPYVLVGHSLGGFVCHAFASLYPQDIIGVLFLESSTIEDVEASKLKHNRKKLNPNSEVNCVRESVEQLKKMNAFPQVPMKVIAGFHPLTRLLMPKAQYINRLENQKKLLELSVDSELIIATKSGHFPQISESKLVAKSICDLVTSGNLKLSEKRFSP